MNGLSEKLLALTEAIVPVVLRPEVAQPRVVEHPGDQPGPHLIARLRSVGDFFQFHLFLDLPTKVLVNDVVRAIKLKHFLKFRSAHARSLRGVFVAWYKCHSAAFCRGDVGLRGTWGDFQFGR